MEKLENLRQYLDPETNILSEPGKIQIQLVEGDSAFQEAIMFLKKLSPLKPLQWDDTLAMSAQDHVNDIGPKGLLLYQSSDGTEPEDRIAKYGTYIESMGENIDFGPNDALGVLISLTLDDGEEERPHRVNLFSSDYQKIGIACGTHQTEFQMCVMDFAYDFIPNRSVKNKNNQKYSQNPSNNSQLTGQKQYQQSKQKENIQENNRRNDNNQSPYVHLSLESEELNKQENNKEEGQVIEQKGNGNNVQNYVKSDNELENLASQTKGLLSQMKVVEKKVTVTTKIVYTYEDGSTKEVTQVENHTFN